MAFYNIRLAVYKRLLKRKWAAAGIVHQSVLLRNAEKIGILFDASDSSNFVAIQHFSDALKKEGKRVDVLGYIDAKHTIDLINHPHFNRKSLSFFFQPRGNEVDYFLEKEFDILLYVHPRFNPALFYLSLLSKARMRVGPLLNEFPLAKEAFEFMINLGQEKPDIRNLLDTYSKYLKMMDGNG